MEPLQPRITKSTAITAIKARFETIEEMLNRFEVAKHQANLWDGERDGLREAVKTIEPGTYGELKLTKSSSAPVVYPNADGKYHLESCLQCTIPRTEAGIHLQAYGCNCATPEEFLDTILHKLQTSKAAALEYLQSIYLGEGITVDNLYTKSSSEKAVIS